MSADRVYITRKLEIDAGHRLQNHEGKCRHVHGHRYVLDLTCSASKFDQVGRVIDFGVVKQVFGGWLDEQLDHGFIAERGDPIIEFLTTNGSKVHIVDWPPTAENLSMYLFGVANAVLAGHNVTVQALRVYETPNCWSDFPGRR